MAIILTVILVVIGTASPVLAAELVSASGELISAEEELVSAAALSDDNELDVASALKYRKLKSAKLWQKSRQMKPTCPQVKPMCPQTLSPPQMTLI